MSNGLADLRRGSVWQPRLVAALLAATAIAVVATALPHDESRPRLLEGAVFWIGDPLKQKSEKRVTAMAFSADGTRLIGGKENGLVQTIDVAGRRRVGSFKGHDSEVNAIVFRPGKESYFTSGSDGRIREFGAPDGTSVDLRGQSVIGGSPMAISPDGKIVAVGHYVDKRRHPDAVSLHDAATGKRLRGFRDEHHPDSIAFSSDSRFLLCVGTWGNQIKLWDVEKAELAWSRTEGRAFDGAAVDAPFLSGCAFGPTEQEYTVAIDNSWGDALVCIYDFKTGAVRKQFSSSQGHIKFVISPDGKTLAIGGYDAILDLWDVKTGKRLRSFFGEQERIFSLAFSPDSRLIASGGDDGTVIVWAVTAEPRN